ncbi:MAG: phospholipase [Gammaproteobacteria bacterium]|nr:phospholipase [Gammaproteobacteria bacterium]
MAQIARARTAILVDMFLFNDWQGPDPETHRALAEELTQALITQKTAHPNMTIVVISDPVNTVYEGVTSHYFDALTAAGISVVLTDLTQLQDSNPLYSGVWRYLIRPFGNSEANTLPNPLGPGRVSIRSYLALLNFKANHRKLLITDSDTELEALVMSANPHDGSSAHRNVALQFGGEAARDLLKNEVALLRLCDELESVTQWPTAMAVVQAPNAANRVDQRESITGFPELTTDTQHPQTIRVVNESAIQQAALAMLDEAKPGSRIDLVMFYLSDRDIVNGLIDAHSRGASVRVLLDVNKDAFGRSKNGVPNQPVARELHEAGIDVRWCVTLGEQCHGKMLIAELPDRHALLLGSGNYTRRNLDDFNLESNVLFTSDSSGGVIADATEYFATQWNNTTSETYSADYTTYAKTQWWLTPQYRIMEFTGIGTF